MEQSIEVRTNNKKFHLLSFIIGIPVGILLTLFILLLITILVDNKVKIWFAKKEAEKLKKVSITRMDQFDFSLILNDFDNNIVSPTMFQNKPFFVLIWDPDCFHCISTIIHVQNLYEETKDFNIPVFTLAEKRKMKKSSLIMAELQSTVPVYFADSKDIERCFGSSFPIGLIVDSRGNIVYRHLGSIDWYSTEVIQMLINLANQTVEGQQ